MQLYMPHAQVPTTGMSLAIKTTIEPETLSTSVQREVIAVDPEQPVWSIRTTAAATREPIVPPFAQLTVRTVFAWRQAMCCTRQVLVLAFGLSVLPTAARAQTEGQGDTAARIEVGGVAGVINNMPTYGANLAFGIASNRSVELAGAIMRLGFDESGTYVVAQAQWRQSGFRHPKRQLFVTIGGTSILQYVHRLERRTTRPDGSVLVIPESRSFGRDGTWGPHAGFGGQHALPGRTVIRWDVQLLLLLAEGVHPLARVTVGVARLFGGAL